MGAIEGLQIVSESDCDCSCLGVESEFIVIDVSVLDFCSDIESIEVRDCSCLFFENASGICYECFFDFF